MRDLSPVPETVAGKTPGQNLAPNLVGQVVRDTVVKPSSMVEAPAPASTTASPARSTDLPGEAVGRRVLSAAFVMIGPDGHLTVELRDGRVLVLRDVAMRPGDYCGVEVSADRSGAKHCGGYADVAAARPGGGRLPDDPAGSLGLGGVEARPGTPR